MNARLLIVTFFTTVVLYGMFVLADNAYAFIATSTNFTVYQTIAGIAGSSTVPWSTGGSFMEIGDNEAVMGSSTGASFILNSGLLWDIVGSKSQGGSGVSLTFTVDSGTENFPNLSPGTLVATSSILAVTTNNTDGFNVTVARNDSTGTMSLGTTYIPDKAAWSPGANCASAGNATASSTQEQTLQFRVQDSGTDSSDYCSSWWGSDDTTAHAIFAGFPSSAKQIITRSSATSGASISRVLYNLDVPSTQKTGTYSGTITYVSTTNP